MDARVGEELSGIDGCRLSFVDRRNLYDKIIWSQVTLGHISSRHPTAIGTVNKVRHASYSTTAALDAGIPSAPGNLFQSHICDPEMATNILTRLGRRQVRFYRQKPMHDAKSLTIRLTHNVVPNVTKVEKIILDNIKVS